MPTRSEPAESRYPRYVLGARVPTIGYGHSRISRFFPVHRLARAVRKDTSLSLPLGSSPYRAASKRGCHPVLSSCVRYTNLSERGARCSFPSVLYGLSVIRTSPSSVRSVQAPPLESPHPRWHNARGFSDWGVIESAGVSFPIISPWLSAQGLHRRQSLAVLRPDSWTTLTPSSLASKGPCHWPSLLLLSCGIPHGPSDQ